MTASFRNANPAELASALQDARDYTLALFDCFAAVGLDAPHNVPVRATLNPPLWELGHIAWFAEWYILREADSSAPDAAQKPSMLTRGDDWFDSNTVPHRMRWHLDLPNAGAMKTYCFEVLDRVLDKLTRVVNGDAALYPYRLALAHEDMHGEAMAYTLQSLGVVPIAALERQEASPPAQGELRFGGGVMELGSASGTGFVFDNEKWAHRCELAPFSMDAGLVSNGQFAEFVEDDGYQYPQFWSEAGCAWLMQQGLTAPLGWQRDGRMWSGERFGTRHPLYASEAVRHVSLHEAQAWCRWAGRRLPTEAEWEYAALAVRPGFRWGELWEWTASVFEPYPGFSADAYREYSAPWFGTHQVLRGASFATRARMRHAKYRNFYLPERNDVFAGFRTCAV